MTKKGYLLTTLVVVLSGCGHTVHRGHAEKYERTMPECFNEAHCDAMWGAARKWVQEFAGYPIRYDDGEVLQTYGPSRNDVALAVTVTKKSYDNSYMLEMRAKCANSIQCRPNEHKAALRFNVAVSAVPDPTKGN